MGTSGLYDASTFGLSKSGYTVTGWLNVDGDGRVYNTYDFSSRYSIDDFRTKNGLILKEDNEGAYIYLQPVWKYTNTKPVITYEDVYVLITSDITPERLLKDVKAEDKEDGDLSGNVVINNLDSIKEYITELKEINSNEEREEIFLIQVEVSDAHGEITVAEVPLHIIIQGQENEKKGYVRYISSYYQNYFNEESIWKTQEHKQVLMLLE